MELTDADIAIGALVIALTAAVCTSVVWQAISVDRENRAFLRGRNLERARQGEDLLEPAPDLTPDLHQYGIGSAFLPDIGGQYE